MKTLQRYILENVEKTSAFTRVGEYKNGFALVKNKEGKFNFIDKVGNLLSQTWYDRACEFDKRGVGDVKLHGRDWQSITPEGKLIKLVESQDLSDVNTSWSPKEGLFIGNNPQEIANYLLKNSKDKGQAMKRLVFYMNRAGDKLTNKEVLNQVKQLLQEGKIVMTNDEGEEVPNKCSKCGGKVGLYIKDGEPVFLCSKCGKYFGTRPFKK